MEPTNESKEEILKTMDNAIEQLTKINAMVSNYEDSDSEDINDPSVSLLTQKSSYKVMVVGSGSREIAIINSLSESKFNVEILSISNNINPSANLNINVKNIIVIKKDMSQIVTSAKKHNIDMAIVCSDEYIQNDLVNMLTKAGFLCIGPTSSLAMIGTDRSYMRDLLTNYDLGQFNPKYKQFGEQNQADLLKFITEDLMNNFVIKHPLSINKSNDIEVPININNIGTAEEICNQMILSHGSCLIESVIKGNEFSIVSFTDGYCVHHSPIIKSYKYFNNNIIHDKGTLTNGIGCVTLTDHKMPYLNDDDIMVAYNVIAKTIVALQDQTQEKYMGIIQCNFIKDNIGEIKIIDFEPTMGDPEAISLLGILDSDFMEICLRITKSSLEHFNMKFLHESTYVMYSLPIGYPKTEYIDREIYIDNHDISCIMCNQIYQRPPCDKMTILGERAVAIIGKGQNIQDARIEALSLIKTIHGPIVWQMNIGNDVIEMLSNVKLSNLISCQRSPDYMTDIIKMSDNKNQSASITKYYKGYHSYVIGSVTDKANLILDYHDKTNAFYTLGLELVNQCINNTLAKGTYPATFMCKFDMDKLNKKYYTCFMNGVTNACKRSNCQVIDSSVSESPHTLIENKFNLTGFMAGYVSDSKKIFNMSQMKPGDLVYSINIDGIQTDGINIVQNMLNHSSLKKDLSTVDFVDFIKWVTTEHMSYAMEIDSFIACKIDIKCIIHINNGGLIGSVDKIMPLNLKVVINENILKNNMSRKFDILSKYCNLDDISLRKIFGCGIGMLFIISPKDIKNIALVNHHRNWGYIKQIGKIVERQENDYGISFSTYKL